MRALALAVAAAVPAAAQAPPTLAAGTPVPLLTTQALSSKTSAKGDPVAMRTAADVLVGGAVAIPAGTEAVGQVAESRGTGGMGTAGRLAIRPLYLSLGGRTVRLAGRPAGGNGKTKADTVIGMALLSPLLSGRSAVVPAGTRVDAVVEKAVALGR